MPLTGDRANRVKQSAANVKPYENTSFVRVPIGLVLDKRLSNAEKVALIGLLRLGLGTEPRSISLSRLAEIANVPRSSLKRALAGLEKSNLIKREKRAGIPDRIAFASTPWPELPWIPVTAAWFADEVSLRARVLLLFLLFCRHRSGTLVWPTEKTLQNLTDWDRKTLKRALKELVLAGWIARTKVEGLGLRGFTIATDFLIDVEPASYLHKPIRGKGNPELDKPLNRDQISQGTGLKIPTPQSGENVDLKALLPRFFTPLPKSFKPKKEETFSVKGGKDHECESLSSFLSDVFGKTKDKTEKKKPKTHWFEPGTVFLGPDLPPEYEHLARRGGEGAIPPMSCGEAWAKILRELREPPVLPEESEGA